MFAVLKRAAHAIKGMVQTSYMPDADVMLLLHGQDPLLCNDQGETARDLAACNGHTSLVTLLHAAEVFQALRQGGPCSESRASRLAAQLEPESVNVEIGGNSLLDAAIHAGNQEFVATLIGKGGTRSSTVSGDALPQASHRESPNSGDLPQERAYEDQSCSGRKVLIVGGTQFMGRVTVSRLVQAGYEVTIVTRGVSENPHPRAAVRHLVCDRNRQRETFRRIVVEEGPWFAVVDFVAFRPAQVRSVAALYFQ